VNLSVYLHYPGNCEEALNFYKQGLGGEIEGLQYFAQSNMPVPDEYKNKVLHATFRFGNNLFMASDSLPGHPATAGSNFALSLDLEDLPQMETLFNKLSAGGKITMPLQDTSWGARFGMFTDAFGINWMLNCQLKKG